MAVWYSVHTRPPAGQHPDLGSRASPRSLSDLVQPNPDLSDSDLLLSPISTIIHKPWSEKYQAETEIGLRAVPEEKGRLRSCGQSVSRTKPGAKSDGLSLVGQQCFLKLT